MSLYGCIESGEVCMRCMRDGQMGRVYLAAKERDRVLLPAILRWVTPRERHHVETNVTCTYICSTAPKLEQWHMPGQMARRISTNCKRSLVQSRLSVHIKLVKPQRKRELQLLGAMMQPLPSRWIDRPRTDAKALELEEATGVSWKHSPRFSLGPASRAAADHHHHRLSVLPPVQSVWASGPVESYPRWVP